MTADREQTRRDAPKLREAITLLSWTRGVLRVKATEELDSLLAELKQAERERKEAAESEARLAQIVVRDKARLASAERERDEWKEILDEARVTRDSLKARLASVPALVEALRTILNSAEDANQEYRRLDIALAARNALTVYEQSQGKP